MVSGATYDLLVIGSGPGGYIGAIRAAQLGMRVACVDRESQLGGTCLRVGCIPSKALLESSHLYWEAKENFSTHGLLVGNLKLDLSIMHRRKTSVVSGLVQGIGGLFKKHKIARLTGHATFRGRGSDGIRVAVAPVEGQGDDPSEVIAKKVIIATGSTEARLTGVELDGDLIGTSTEALNYASVPEHLVVIGAGAIGLELGSVWCRLGAKVTVLEYAPRILPGMDAELSAAAQRVFAKQGLAFRLESRVVRARRDGSGCLVELANAEPVHCNRVLMAVGRVPNTSGLGLEAVGIVPDKRGRISVDKHFATQAAEIYAIGDVIPGPMLAHKAEEDAVACVEQLATGYGHVDYNTVALVVYTAPEIAGVGKNEQDLQQEGIPYRKGSFPFMANARARAAGDTVGFVKILAHKETDRVLGVHMMGPHVSEIVAEAVASMTYGASSEDMARVCHAHPTLSEAVKEAALAVDGRTLNL